MKKITIYQREASDVEILDDSDMDIDSYCQEISKMFNMTNVVILKTTQSTFIGRPSQLTGIVVEEFGVEQEVELEPELEEPEEIPEKVEEIQEDIITDID